MKPFETVSQLSYVAEKCDQFYYQLHFFLYSFGARAFYFENTIIL